MIRVIELSRGFRSDEGRYSRGPVRQVAPTMILIFRFFLVLALVSFSMGFEASAQTPDSTPTTDCEWPWPVGVLLVESVAFGSAAVARSETGARAIGTLQGISGLAVLSIAAFSDGDTGRPEFTVPYGVGLAVLAYYNLRHADSPRRQQRFWVNAIGFNVAVLAGVLFSEAFGERNPGSAGERSSAARFVVSVSF